MCIRDRVETDRALEIVMSESMLIFECSFSMFDKILYSAVVLNIILTILTPEGCDLYYNSWTLDGIGSYNSSRCV